MTKGEQRITTSKSFRFYGFLYLALAPIVLFILETDPSTFIICGVVLEVGSKLAAILEAKGSADG